MTDNYLPFAIPEIGEEEINLVVECMKSGWLTTGKYAKKFEEDFAAYIGKNLEPVAVNSASMGLFLVMEAMGIGKSDEVIVPTLTFSATAMMAVHLGATPVFVDVDPKTLNVDSAKIEAAITEKTKAIIAVHFAGLSCDLNTINAIAKRHNLYVIEDAAHALPTTYKGRKIGDNTSHAAVYSFYATKTITTGEGGMILTNDEKIAARCRMMRLHGISRDVFDRYTAKGSKWFYEIVAPGYKCNLTDIASCIGIEQLKKADLFLKKRTAIAEEYSKAFKDLPIILPAKANDGDIHSWHLYTIRLNDSVKMSREEFIAKMDDLGIGCSVHFIPLHLHPYYAKEFNYKVGDFPNSEKAFERLISLPIYTKMSDGEILKVINAVRSILC